MRRSPVSRSSNCTTAALIRRHCAITSEQARLGQGAQFGTLRVMIGSSGATLQAGDAAVEEGVLDHLGPAGALLAVGEGAQQVRIDHDQLRLEEGPDQVLAGREVDAGLPADAAIDHRQQRGRHLHQRHAAQVGRGDEAGEVADHPAAERDDRLAALGALARQPGIEFARAGQRLALLAVRDGRGGDTPAGCLPAPRAAARRAPPRPARR